MQKSIELFEQDFARWGLHLPTDDANARRSGMVQSAGWHVLYDFGRDNRGEYLDYYAALREGSDASVTDDWHFRLYDCGDRVPLPTVLEAYMYSRDPTREELARARRHFMGVVTPSAPQAAAVAPRVSAPTAAATAATVASNGTVATAAHAATASPSPRPSAVAAPGGSPAAAPPARIDAPAAAATAAAATAAPAIAAGAAPSAAPTPAPSAVASNGLNAAPDAPTIAVRKPVAPIAPSAAPSAPPKFTLDPQPSVAQGLRMAPQLVGPSRPGRVAGAGAAGRPPAAAAAAPSPTPPARAVADATPAPARVSSPLQVEHFDAPVALSDDAASLVPDIALEVGLDAALAGLATVPNGDTMALWMLTPASVSLVALNAEPAPPISLAVAGPTLNDGVGTSDLFAADVDGSQAMAAAMVATALAPIEEDVPPAMAADTMAVNLGDEPAPGTAPGAALGTEFAPEIERAPSVSDPRPSGRVRRKSLNVALPEPRVSRPFRPSGPGSEAAPAPDAPSRRRRATPVLVPNSGDTNTDDINPTDVAVVAGAFDPWWYRPSARRGAAIAAACAVLIIVGSAVARYRSHQSSPATDTRHVSDAPIGAVHSGAPAPSAESTAVPAGDATGDSTRSRSDIAPDSLSASSPAPPARNEPAPSPAEEGMARPVGPQSVPPIQSSSAPHGTVGTVKAPAKTVVRASSR